MLFRCKLDAKKGSKARLESQACCFWRSVSSVILPLLEEFHVLPRIVARVAEFVGA